MNPHKNNRVNSLAVSRLVRRLAPYATAVTLLVAGTAWAQLTTLHSFNDSPDAKYPFWAPIQAADGFFYGVTGSGGASDGGTVYRVDSTGGFAVIHSFSPSGPEGHNPTSLIQASDGFFYGTAAQGGGPSGLGTIFRMTSAGVVTVLHSFDGATDGGNPFAPLLEASDGFFYGTAPSGGENGSGTIFRMDSSGVVTLLHSFSGTDGKFPNASLIQASDGLFYGTASSGGDFGYSDGGSGTIFQMDVTGAFTVMHRFLGPPGDGSYPLKSLIQASDGYFYGITGNGGVSDNGTIFRMDSSGSVTILHSFDPSTGLSPYGPLLQAADSLFYGTATFGGVNGFGTIFQMDSMGAVTVIHSFTGGLDGGIPGASLIQEESGGIYGVTQNGGANDFGTFFKIEIPPPPALAAFVQPPINADGSTVFKGNRGVVPGKFSLYTGGSATCTLPPATIAVTRISGGTVGPVNQNDFATPADSGSSFRIAGCQYVYHLDTHSLGTGTYKIDIRVSGNIIGSANFGLK
jgi:uncharacterized repeat protein (TIGR03803 family)